MGKTAIKIICLTFLCWTGILRSQSDTSFFADVRELQRLFSETHYNPMSFTDTSLEVIEKIAVRKRSESSFDRSTYLEKQKELEERDYGLSITGNYLENINPTIGDLEDNLIYSRKFGAGIEWDVLKGGYLENRAQARILEDKIQRNQLMMDATEESYHFLERFDYTIYIFNKVKIQLLEERQIQLSKQAEIIYDLVYRKKLPKEDIINLQTRQAEVESLLKVYKSYNDYLGITDDNLAFDVTHLPLIDLNYEAIFSKLEIQTDSLLSSNVYDDYYAWYHQVRLSPYLRYNYYDLIGEGYRSFLSAGFNVAVPVPFNHKLQNEIEAEKWKYENERLVQGRIDLQEDVLNIGYEFRYKLKQFIAFYQKRKLFMERLRVEKVKVRLGDVNVDPLGALDLHDDLLQIDIELVDLLQNLYLKALKVHSRLPHTDIREIVRPQSAESMSEYLDKKQRHVYVWSKTFAENSAAFLAEYALYNEFKHVIVAVEVGDTLEKEKTLFMNYADESGDVYYMIGNNQFMFDPDPAGYLGKLIRSYGGFSPKGLHLDIEPHTFAEWATEKQRITNQYLEFVGKVHVFCEENDLELSVSIPPHYGPEVVDKLLGLVDKIYFMCYENVKTEYLVGKLSTFTDYGTNRFVIALRTEDFTDRIGMEEKIIELENQTGITNFAYHDLRRMILFDRKSVE